MRMGKPTSCCALKVNRNTKTGLACGYAPAAMATISGVFDESLVLLLVADMKALRYHVAQVFGM
jgi:hypothetical protein